MKFGLIFIYNLIIKGIGLYKLLQDLAKKLMLNCKDTPQFNYLMQ